MKITTESLGPCQLALTVELDEEQSRQSLRRVARQLSEQVNIPGYRRGKAPYDVVLRRLGEDVIRHQIAETLGANTLQEALEQTGITPYVPGSLEEVSLSPVTFKFTISLPPVVELGNYRDYRLKPRKARVFRSEIREALEAIREQNAVFELVQRPAALNDGVAIDVIGRTADGVEFLNQKNMRLLLEDGSNLLAAGFVEELVGMAAGDEKTFTLTLADDFPREDLRGKEAEFTVKILEVYEGTVPALDDDLARAAGNFNSLQELEAHLEQRLLERSRQQVEKEYQERVLKDIIEQARVEYPPILLEAELESLVQEFEAIVKRDMRLSLQDYLRVQGLTLETLREELRPQAEARLKRGLVLGEVVKAEGIEVNDEELDAYIERLSAVLGERARLDSEETRNRLRNQLLADKAIKRLLEIAREGEEEADSEEEES
ncbi:MAG: trigger factor [Anaerolineae bacterium]|nr:trigger factor [Anaerolineae bacterium]